MILAGIHQNLRFNPVFDHLPPTPVYMFFIYKQLHLIYKQLNFFVFIQANKRDNCKRSQSNMSTYDFDFNQQLPTVEHVVKGITDLAPGGSPDEKKETKVRKNVISAYIKQLMEIWTKSFGKGHYLNTCN